LCAEGRWEYAISAMRQLEVESLLAREMERKAMPGDGSSSRSG